MEDKRVSKNLSQNFLLNIVGLWSQHILYDLYQYSACFKDTDVCFLTLTNDFL